MPTLFDDASTEYYSSSTTPITAAPFTVSCWWRTDDLTVDQAMIGIGDTGADNDDWFLYIDAQTGNERVAWGSRAGGSLSQARTGKFLNDNNWHHAVGIERANNDREVIVDSGAQSGTNTTTSTPSGIDAVHIGARARASVTNHFSGDLAHAAIWDVALSTAECHALGRGANPLVIRRQNLVGYWPLVAGLATEADLSGGTKHNMTENGTPVKSTSGPPVMPFPRLMTPYYFIPGGAPPVTDVVQDTIMSGIIPFAR